MKFVRSVSWRGALGCLLLLYACAEPPKIHDFFGGGSGGAGPGGLQLPPSSLDHFKTYVFPLVGTSAHLAGDAGKTESGYYCTNCHHTENHADLRASHNYFLENGRFNFDRVASSTTVSRLAGGHNCWSDCSANAQELSDALASWLDAIVADGFQIPEQDVGIKALARTPFQDATAHTLVLDPNVYLGGAITEASRTNTWLNPVANANDGSLNSYVVAPAGGGRKGANNATAGTASFQLDIPADGDYYVFTRVMFPDEDQNELFVNDGVNNFILTSEPTTDTWGWRQLMSNNDESLPQPLTLTAGPQTITLREREGGVRVSYLLLSPRPDPNTEILALELFDVEVDISDVAGIPASIVATIWAKAQGEEQNKVIGVKELRIIAEQALTIKGIKPLINGHYELSHSTYTAVDGVFGSPEGDVITTGGATGSTWLGNMQTDDLGFAFEAIGPAP